MNILAVDDEFHALRDLQQTIEAAVPGSTPACFGDPEAALLHARDCPVDIAFLDIEMGGMNGLALAKALKDIRGDTNIIFVTGYSEYARDAFSVAASDYLVKPVSPDAIRSAMGHLRNPVNAEPRALLEVRTFGNFEVFACGAAVHFSRSKSKELFAYLIHKKGTGVTIRELASVLFEHFSDETSLHRQMQTIISDMLKTLEQVSARETVIRRRNSIAVDPTKVDCDYYRFLKWETDAVNSYTGEFMANYSWAEFTVGYLDSRIR